MLFHANYMAMDYRIKGEYVWVWSVLRENSRKRLQNLKVSGSTSNSDLEPK